MKPRIIIALFAALMTFSSVAAKAAGLAATKAKVIDLHVESGQTHVILDKPHINPDKCPASNRLVLTGNIPAHDVYVSLLVTALSTGKLVTIYVNGCTWTPWGQELPRIYVVALAA